MREDEWCLCGNTCNVHRNKKKKTETEAGAENKKVIPYVAGWRLLGESFPNTTSRYTSNQTHSFLCRSVQTFINKEQNNSWTEVMDRWRNVVKWGEKNTKKNKMKQKRWPLVYPKLKMQRHNHHIMIHVTKTCHMLSR